MTCSAEALFHLLMNPHVAGTRVHRKPRAAIPDLALDSATGFAYLALNDHDDRTIDCHFAGTGRRLEIEGGLLRQINFDVAGAGSNFPVTRLRARRTDVTASRAGHKRSVDAAQFYCAGAGLDVHIAGSLGIQTDIAAATLRCKGPGDFTGLDVA